MKTDTRDLLAVLKENNEDFEWYPTTREIVEAIFKHNYPNGYACGANFDSVLDIGCGTCNFLTHWEQIEKDLKLDRPSYFKYFVMEKSQTLIDLLPKEAIVLGTDFHQSILFDKEVDVIFCNPPYSEFEDWTRRIIFESAAKRAYLVIPTRWKEDKLLMADLVEKNVKYEVVGSFDFLLAERQARAKVDIVYFNREEIGKHRGYKDFAFNEFFDRTFPMEDLKKADDYQFEEEKREQVKNALVGGQNKGEILVNLYNGELKTLYKHFRAITGMDAAILKSIGVNKESVKEALKSKIVSLKKIYWKSVFENLEEITTRLTSESRTNLYNQFEEIHEVDFTASNIYAVIIWVIKNANQCYNDQIISFFKSLTSYENCRAYKSNQSTFQKDKYRYNSLDERASHYTLDYRIVVSNWALRQYYSYDDKINKGKLSEKLSDISTIAENLGFPVAWQTITEIYGKQESITLKDGRELLEYRCYKNGNIHCKFSKEFMKALNVEASRLLGWIRSKEDIAAEFTPEMAEGAEKYFKVNAYIPLAGNNIPLLTSSTEAQC